MSLPAGTVERTDTTKAVRWPFWLLAGVVFGLLLGFAAGLAKPREWD